MDWLLSPLRDCVGSTAASFPSHSSLFRMCHRTSFSEHGLGIYMASPSELEKYTVCAEMADQSTEAMGELFVACEMPETPKNTSFLKGVSSIFGASPRASDGADIDLICSFLALPRKLRFQWLVKRTRAPREHRRVCVLLDGQSPGRRPAWTEPTEEQ